MVSGSRRRVRPGFGEEASFRKKTNVSIEKVQNINISERPITVAAKTSLGEIQKSRLGEEFIQLRLVEIIATS